MYFHECTVENMIFFNALHTDFDEVLLIDSRVVLSAFLKSLTYVTNYTTN